MALPYITELPYVSGRVAPLLMWHSLCCCLLVQNVGMQWLAKVWLKEPCCLSASPPAGEACVCPLGVGSGVEVTDGEGEKEIGRIKLDQMEHQAISIFSISLWICKPDRSSRHQWLSSPWNSKQEEGRRGRCFHPVMVVLSVTFYKYLCVCVCEYVWEGEVMHVNDSSVCITTGKAWHRFMKYNCCHRIVFSITCLTMWFCHIMEIHWKKRMEPILSSWGAIVTGVFVFPSDVEGLKP